MGVLLRLLREGIFIRRGLAAAALMRPEVPKCLPIHALSRVAALSMRLPYCRNRTAGARTDRCQGALQTVAVFPLARPTGGPRTSDLTEWIMKCGVAFDAFDDAIRPEPADCRNLFGVMRESIGSTGRAAASMWRSLGTAARRAVDANCDSTGLGSACCQCDDRIDSP